MATAAGKPNQPKVVSSEQWLNARVELLKKEKELTRLRDELSRQRQELPWEKVEKNYVFDGPNGKETLAQLFGGRSQLIVYHFMLGPDWKEGCPSCSLIADHMVASISHLAARDVRLVVVSRAPLAQIAEFQKRMGWNLHWVSSNGTDFNRDYQASVTKQEAEAGETYYNYGMRKFPSEERPGASVFFKDAAGSVVSHLLDLRTRLGDRSRRLQLARPDTQGPRRGRLALAHGLGPPPRQVRRAIPGRHESKDRPLLLRRRSINHQVKVTVM